MARLVELHDTRPLAIKKSEMTGDVWVCRCGLSAAWPYCDGSHSKTRDEETGAVYAYNRASGQLQRTTTHGVASGQADPRARGGPPEQALAPAAAPESA